MADIQWMGIGWQLHHEIMSIIDEKAYGSVNVVFWLALLLSHQLVT